MNKFLVGLSSFGVVGGIIFVNHLINTQSYYLAVLNGVFIGMNLCTFTDNLLSILLEKKNEQEPTR